MKLRIEAIGHLGRDCSVKNMDGGVSAINFSVATTERYKDKSTGAKMENTTWVDCVLWRKSDQLKVAEHLLKGTLINVEGKPSSRGYKSKTDPDKINSVITIRVDKLVFLGKPSVGSTNQNSQEQTLTTNDAPVFTSDVSDDDLPF